MLPAPSRPHDAQFVLHAEQHAEHVGVEGLGVGLRSLVDDRARVALGPRVVDGDVNAPELGDSPVDQGLDLALVANVRLDEESFCAEGPELGLQCPAGLAIAAGDDDLGALACGRERGGAADAGKSACDQNDLILHHPLSEPQVIT